MPRKNSQECWALGDWALAKVPVGAAGPNTGGLALLKELAAEKDVSYRALLQYRGVSHDWPPETRRPDVAWSVHDVLRYDDDRFQLIWTEVGRSTTEAKKYVRSRSPKRPSKVCRICGGKHKAKGLCEKCYFKERYRAQRDARPKGAS